MKRCLESVDNQTFIEYEILLVDDGSQENIAEEAALLTGKSKKVKFFQKNHGGVSSARNFAVKKAQGEFIAFLDSDDEWLPEKLEKQIAFMRDGSYQISQTDEFWVRRGEQVTPPKKYAKKPDLASSLSHCIIGASTVMMTQDYFLKLGGFDETLPVCEDYDLWLRVLCERPVPLIEEKLTVKHGGRSDQLSEQYRALDRYRVLALEKCYTRGTEIPETARRLVYEMLVRKLTYLRDGALRRGTDASVYSAKLEAYRHFR